MLKGFFILFICFLLVMSLGLLARWVYFTLISAPGKAKRYIQKTLNRGPVVIEEHNTYNDIKVLNIKD